MPAEVGGDHDTAHLAGNVRAGEDLESAEFGLAGIEAFEDSLGSG